MNAVTRRGYLLGDRVMAEHPEFGCWSHGTITGVASMGPGGTSVWVEFDIGERCSLPLTDIRNLDKTEREKQAADPLDEAGLLTGKAGWLIAGVFGLAGAVAAMAAVIHLGERLGWFH